MNWRGSNLPEVMCNNSGEGSIFPKYGQKFENKCCGEFAFQNVKFYQEKKKALLSLSPSYLNPCFSTFAAFTTCINPSLLCKFTAKIYCFSS